MSRHVQVVAAAMLLTYALGCAAGSRTAEMPLGHWKGQGLFVLDRWGDDEEDAAEHVVEYGSYKTSLTLEEATFEGRPAVRMEIVSLRGETKELDGDRTHLVAVLQKEESVLADTVALYRVAQFGLSLDEDEPSLEDAAENARLASGMQIGKEFLLRIHYQDNFVDLFQFTGNMLHKHGTFGGPQADGIVHWSETLRRQR